MTPDEILLGPPRPEPEESGEPADLKTPVAPKIIEAAVLDRLLKAEPVVNSGSMRIIGDISRIADVSDVPLRVCCRCVRWDLTNESERTAYAELLNRATEENSSIAISWEERVVHEAAIIVYLTYLEYVRIVEDLNV